MLAESFHYVDARGRKYPLDGRRFRGDDGQLLHLVGPTPQFAWGAIRKRPATMWRYAEALSLPDDLVAQVSLGEGMTPLVPFGPRHPRLLCKLEYLMPTLSFKDRGAAVLMAVAKHLGVSECVVDSSGNAGTSVAAYAARAGITCQVFVPAGVSPQKLTQMTAHGAIIRAIEGTRADVAAAALAQAEEKQAFYASHVYNPWFFEGTKTYIFEVFEQIGRMPDVLVLPVGNGSLALGVNKGLQELQGAKCIQRLPHLILVQAQNCAPLAEAWQQHRTTAASISIRPTLAEGISIAQPPRGEQILAVARATHGGFVSVTEEEIRHAQRALARRGFYVEPTSAVNYAGYLKWLSSDPEAAEKSTVIPLCGAGLKSGNRCD